MSSAWFSTGLIASSHAYDSLRFPWGSNPLTDPLLSSDRLQIINDGGECSRWEKAEAIAEWEPALKHLRVCHKGKQRDRNCGVCPNCLFTADVFRAGAGTAPHPSSQPTGFLRLINHYKPSLKTIGVRRLEY